AGLRDPGAGAVAIDQLLKSPDVTQADVLAIGPVLDANKWEEVERQLLEGPTARGMAGFDLLHALGRLYDRMGKLKAARATLERAAETRPGSVDILLELAHLADRQNDYKGALSYLA